MLWFISLSQNDCLIQTGIFGKLYLLLGLKNRSLLLLDHSFL